MTESRMTPEKATALRRPFPPESIGKLPKGGQMLDFAGHAAVTDRLLAVDPHWSWEPFAIGEDGLPAIDRHGNLWIRLTICGVTRIGVGDGAKNAKELVSDALRNGAMRFGVGLDLWAKENLVEFAQAANRAAPSGAPSPAPEGASSPPDEPLPPVAPQHDSGGHPIDVEAGPMSKRTRGQMFALFADLAEIDPKLADEDEQRRGMSAILGREVTSRGSLTEGEALRVIKRLKDKKKAAPTPVARPSLPDPSEVA